MTESVTSKSNTPVIDNPEQASSNFYWLYHTTAGAFNIQTTIRGILTPPQIQAHIKSLLEAIAHIVQLGGIAKQVGKSAETPGEPLPEILPSSGEISSEPQYVPLESEPAKAEEFTFTTDKLSCSISNGRQYFKVKGGQWSRYGVTVWPEVLAQVEINAQKLEAKEYNFPGYKATYTKNAKGQPEKVIKLEKVA